MNDDHGLSRRRFLQIGAASGSLLLGLAHQAEANQMEANQMEAKPMISQISPGGYTAEPIHFRSGGEEVAGMLMLPGGMHGKRPAVALLGPFGFVKEQSPAQYAARLADAGFAALIFDPRGSGESGGLPRRWESPRRKIADARAALDFLATRPEVDADRLGALGVCQGSSEMIAVAAEDARVKALALVSGQYLYPKNIDGFFSAGGPTRTERIERGKKARTKFESTGEVDYTEVVSLTDKNAGLPWKPIHDWYAPWTTDKWGEKSRWENRYATLSDAEVWAFNVEDYAPKVSVPTLIIHGEKSDGGVKAARHVFDLLGVQEKSLRIVPGVFHTRFYDDPLVVDPAATEVAGWFQSHLTAMSRNKG